MSAKWIPQGPADQDLQLKVIKEYAQEKYEHGWDIVVETMSDQDIRDLIDGTKTCWGAIERVSAAIRPLISYRRDIQGA